MILHIFLSIVLLSSFQVPILASIGGCIDHNSVCNGESSAKCEQSELLRQSCPCLCRIPPTMAVKLQQSNNYLKKCCQAKGMTPSCQDVCSRGFVENMTLQKLIKYQPLCTPPNDGSIWLQCASTNRDLQKCCKTDLGHGRVWDEPSCHEICQGRHPGRRMASICFLRKFDAMKRCLLDWDENN